MSSKGPCWDLGAGGVGGTAAGPCPRDEPSRALRPKLGDNRGNEAQIAGRACGWKPLGAAGCSWARGLSVQHSHHCG